VFFCGDGICNNNETCGSCPDDCGNCGAQFFCGDETCNGEETCTTCPSDCGACPPPPPPPVCGDGTCNGDENCRNCSSDCGKCITDIIIDIPPKISEFVRTPEGSVVTKIITTTGVATGIVVTTSVIVFSPLSIFELFLLPTRLFGFLIGVFGFRRKRVPWGVVYDSVTKQPLDPAYVVLKDSQGKEVSTAITDLDGRYGFLVDLGVYNMIANKTHYIFPSQKLAGRTRDELYEYLYFGDKIEIKSTGEAITRNIPMDPVKFDWNEFAKMDKKLMRFYSKWDLFITKISDIFFVVGFIISVIAYFSAPYPYNTIIMGLYLFLLILRILGLRPRSFGYVIEKATNNPLSFAIIRIFLADSEKEVSHRITDRYGRYLCLLPAGRYYLKIEKKNDDGSYSLVHLSSVINVSKKGIIKEVFRV